MAPEIKDPQIWKAAQQRVRFKFMALIYLIMNTLFWTVWVVNGGNHATIYSYDNRIPWPVWPMVIWGAGLFYRYMLAYKTHQTLTEKEYHRLKNKL